MIDLRSDTITKPTKPMLEAMFNAEVGDDVFEDDPTVNALQEKVASMFGMEAALYCPSGTMTNQIAMRVNTSPQDEVICHKNSHVYRYEGGGMMYNSMLSPKLLEGPKGKISASQIDENVNPDDIHFPKTSLVVVENTMNKGGGSIYYLNELQQIKSSCERNQLKFHLDGARLFNALIESGDEPKAYGKLFDTISICFSKGLGAPVGSALLGTKEVIKQARRVRKVFGGGMRQAGYLAAACIYALDHHIERLHQDHANAQAIGKLLERKDFVEKVYSVETNIVIAKLTKPEGWFLDRLREHDILAVPFGKNLVRFVTHLDFDERNVDEFESKLSKISA
jgi:threonine aldolase